MRVRMRAGECRGDEDEVGMAGAACRGMSFVGLSVQALYARLHGLPTHTFHTRLQNRVCLVGGAFPIIFNPPLPTASPFLTSLSRPMHIFPFIGSF